MPIPRAPDRSIYDSSTTSEGQLVRRYKLSRLSALDRNSFCMALRMRKVPVIPSLMSSSFLCTVYIAYDDISVGNDIWAHHGLC